MCEPQARARKAEDAIAVAQSVRIFPEFGHGQFFERFPWQIETVTSRLGRVGSTWVCQAYLLGPLPLAFGGAP